MYHLGIMCISFNPFVFVCCNIDRQSSMTLYTLNDNDNDIAINGSQLLDPHKNVTFSSLFLQLDNS